MKPLAYIEITVKDNKAIIDNTTTPKTITAYLEDGQITLLPTSDNSSQFVYYIPESVTHATVNQSGVITLNSVGTNTIRIKQYETTNNSVVSVDYTINIIQHPPSTPCGVLFTVNGDSLNFSPSSAALAQQGQNFNQLYKIIAYLLDSNNVPLQNVSSIILDNLTGGAIPISTLGQPNGSHIHVNTSGFMFDGTQIWQDYIDTGFTIQFPSGVVITSFSTYIYTPSSIPVGSQNPYIVIGPEGFYYAVMSDSQDSIDKIKAYANDPSTSTTFIYNGVLIPFNRIVITLMRSMYDMFYNINNFNEDITSWDTSNITNMNGIFSDASAFDKNIGSWNTSKVTSMNNMFNGASVFNQNINSWNTSKVTDMSYMFYASFAFNGDISLWNTSNVTNMISIFASASSFNQDINSWNTSNVTDMSFMFQNASAFNKNIGLWNTSNVTDMSNMFARASSFNQDISSWDVSLVSPKPPTNFSKNSALTQVNSPIWT